MSKFKKDIKRYLVSKINTKLEFDTSRLETNKEKTFNKKLVYRYVALSASFSLVLLIVVPFLSMLEVRDSYSEVKRRYSNNEITLIEDSSFYSLNNITYPSASIKQNVLSEKYKDSIKEFSYNAFINLEQSDKNSIFSPLGLYSNLNLISLGVEDEEVLSELDMVLGLTSKERKDNYKYLYQNDYFYNENGMLQMYNAVFLDNEYEVNSEFVNSLVSYYSEAYSLDLQDDDDISKMLEWFDQRMNDSNYFKKKDLNLSKDSMTYFASTIYFNNKWANRFLNSNTYSSFFKNCNGINEFAQFMNHISYNDLYEYETYYSIYDSYKNNLKIQYILPKGNLDLYDAIENINILNEDINCLKKDVVIDLSVPKFEYDTMLDLTDTLKNMGAESIFNEDGLNNIYNAEIDVTLDIIKQKNVVSFNENATLVKSTTIARGVNKSVGEVKDTVKIVLNRPFIFVVYDSSSLPIYIGSIVNL